MTIQKQISVDLKSAMLNKDEATKSILRVVMGEFAREIEKHGKELPDEISVKVIRKVSNDAEIVGSFKDVEILSKYLPQMLDMTEISTIITKIISDNGYASMADIGKVMGEIKKLPNASLIDGRISSSVVKEMLSK
jgi:hypothetical protein